MSDNLPSGVTEGTISDHAPEGDPIADLDIETTLGDIARYVLMECSGCNGGRLCDLCPSTPAIDAIELLSQRLEREGLV